MIIKEEKCNLFNVDDKYKLAHCISEDLKLGAGIALEFQKRFNLRGELLKYNIEFPACVQIGRVYNLITKRKYWHKPVYTSVECTLLMMRGLALMNDVKFIAMPKIGSGLDRLSWFEVKDIIEEVFKDTDIEILVCYL